tara:strand:+ start:1343 stop:1570 length:228 start_codon:yes stop_codon:yes gene_type:complete
VRSDARVPIGHSGSEVAPNWRARQLGGQYDPDCVEFGEEGRRHHRVCHGDDPDPVPALVRMVGGLVRATNGWTPS